MLVRPFVSTFHTPNYSTWAKSDETSCRQLIPLFLQTRLFTIFPIISTTNRGSPFWENYPYQTKILEGGTKDEMRIFETLFNGS
jgi:hypothetical protein